MQELYPLFLSLAQRRVLIVGGGKLALQKLATLAPTGADVTVAAPRLREDLSHWRGTGKLTLLQQAYDAALLAGHAVVFAATDDAAVNHQVVADARAAGILANAVDDPAHCDFHTPAVVRRGPFTLAISTAGGFPGLSRALRETLEALLPGSHTDALNNLVALRTKLRAAPWLAARRGAALRGLAERFRQEYLEPAAALAADANASVQTLPSDNLEHTA